MLMLPLVEAGELAPTCRACNGDRPVTMHPLEEEWLTERGLAEEGWEEIKAINDSLKAPEINP
jgi:hypothetical protein